MLEALMKDLVVFRGGAQEPQLDDITAVFVKLVEV